MVQDATEIILSFLGVAVPILVAIAYLTLAERKIMGTMQQRLGPNVAGFFGLLQPLADGLKLVLKESVIPTNSNTFSFIFAPILTFFISFINFICGDNLNTLNNSCYFYHPRVIQYILSRQRT